MSHPPTIDSARVIAAQTIEIIWSTGETLCVDLSNYLAAPYDGLRDAECFAAMQVDEWGHGLNWADGLDMGADRLYELCREQAGLPTASAFNTWMQRNSLSLATAAETLGMTRRMIAYYRTGARPIPRYIALACRGWEAEQR
jgi:hypothetical protein